MSALVTLYKAFVRPHLDYVDILYNNAACSFHKIFKNVSPRYILITIPTRNPSNTIMSHANIPLF